MIASKTPKRKPRLHSVKLLDRISLSDATFELELTRPRKFVFIPGQRLRLLHKDVERDYSLVSGLKDKTFNVCVRKVEEGTLSSFLASADIGTRLKFSGPHGYFTFRPSGRDPVFVATGIGIAPFVSMVRSGRSDFTLLHGVRRPSELYYSESLRSAAKTYVPCVTQNLKKSELPAGTFPGRVTKYLAERLPSGAYDFYLCGNGEMIRDVILLVDQRFPRSLVYTEIFF